MKILVVWHNSEVNPVPAVVHAWREAGHVVRLCTNPISGHNYDYGHYAIVMPKFDIPIWEKELLEFQATEDPGKESYLQYVVPWKFLHQAWREMEIERPDFVLLSEGPLSVGGEKPDDWADIPVLYWAFDNGRGADHEMRQASVAGATDILVMCRWYMDYFTIKRPQGRMLRDNLWESGYNCPRVFWMPVCCDPRLFRPYQDENKHYDVLFMGSSGLAWSEIHSDGTPCPSVKDDLGRFIIPEGKTMKVADEQFGELNQRAMYIERMMREKEFLFHFRLSVHGEAYARELSRAKILWNCAGGRESSHYGTGNRVFQGASTGVAVATDDSDEIRDLFIPDEEVVMYKSSFAPNHHLFRWFDYALLRDKILDLLGDEARRKHMAEAGYARVQKDHLPIQRGQRIIDIAMRKAVDPNGFRPVEG